MAGAGSAVRPAGSDVSSCASSNGADVARRDASWAHVAELEEELQELRRRLQKTEDDGSEVQPVHLAVKEDAFEDDQLPGGTEADGNDAEKIANAGKGTVHDGGGRGVRADGEARVAVRDQRRRRRSWSSEGHETSFYGWLHEDGEEDESPISKSMAVDKPGTGAMSQDLVRGPGDDNVVAPAAPLADDVDNAEAPDAAGHHLNLSLDASMEDIPLAADQQQGATEASAAVEEEEEGGEPMLVLETAELRRSWASPSRDWLTSVEHAGPGTAADTDEAGAVDELRPEAAINAADVPEESAAADGDDGQNKTLQVEPTKSEAAVGSGSSSGSGGSSAKGAPAAATPHLMLVPLWDLDDDYDAMVAMGDAEHGGNGRASGQALAVDSLPEADMPLSTPPTSPRQKLGAWLSSLKRNAPFGRGPPPSPPTAQLLGPESEDNTSDGAHQPGPADAQPAEAPQASTTLTSSTEAPERPLPRRLPQRLAFLRSAARRDSGRSPAGILGGGGNTVAASAGEKLVQAGDGDLAQSKGASLAVSTMDAGAVFGEGLRSAAAAGAAMAGNNKENEQAEEEEERPVTPPRPPSPAQQPFRQAASVPPSEDNIVMASVALPPPLSGLFSVRDADSGDARKVGVFDDAGGGGDFKALRRSVSLPRRSSPFMGSDNDDGGRRSSTAAPADALPLAHQHSLPRARLEAWESTRRLRSSESPSRPAHAPARHESPTHAAMLASVGRSNLPTAAAVVATDRSSSPGGERVLRLRLRAASDGSILNLPPWGSPLARSQSVQRSPPPRSRSLVALKPTAALRISAAADDNGLIQNLRQSSSLPRTWRSPSAGRASDREQSLLVHAAAAHWLPPHVGGSDAAIGSPSQQALRAPSPPGIPNSTNKYSEDQTVRWHHTPFEERVERAVSRQEEAHSRRQLFKESRLALKASEHDDLPKRTYLVTGRLSLPSMREAKVVAENRTIEFAEPSGRSS
eukprot:SM000027S09559  [mRNA]  locus=s27:72145:77488:+ [translate_table: standard]